MSNFLSHDSPMGQRIVERFSKEIGGDWDKFLLALDNSPRFCMPGNLLAEVVKKMVSDSELLFHTLGGRMPNADTVELFSRMGDISYRSGAAFPTIGRAAVNDPETTFLRVRDVRFGEADYNVVGASRYSLDEVNDHFMEAVESEPRPEGKEEACCTHVVIFARLIMALHQTGYRVIRVRTTIDPGNSIVEIYMRSKGELIHITLFCGKVSANYWDLRKRYEDAAAARPQPEQTNA